MKHLHLSNKWNISDTALLLSCVALIVAILRALGVL